MICVAGCDFSRTGMAIYSDSLKTKLLFIPSKCLSSSTILTSSLQCLILSLVISVMYLDMTPLVFASIIDFFIDSNSKYESKL